MPRLLCLLAVLLALIGAPAHGQRLQGQLLDLETNEPLIGGLITLLSPDGRDLVTAVTDAEGKWVIEIPGPGTYQVSARHLGYRPWVHGPIAIAGDDDLVAVYHLGRHAVTLDPIEVSAQTMERYLAAAGFYERQRADFGHFITPADIERRQPTLITDLFSGLAGVNVMSAASGSVGGRVVQLRGSNLVQGGVCRPRIFVDGILFARGDSRLRRPVRAEATERRPDDEVQRLDQSLNIDDIGHPSTIAAIEVYRSATQVPVQFGGTSVETLCGVIVVWTRAGSARERAGP